MTNTSPLSGSDALALVLNTSAVNYIPYLSEPLDFRGEDYKRVFERFQETCGSTHYIVSIRRVLGNPLKQTQYNLLKCYMNSGSGANEKQLFHGTDAVTAQKIIGNGFNRSFCTCAAYGNGIYFARQAKYSANAIYSVPDESRDGLQSMFLTRVLVGQYTRGRPKMITPPLLKDSKYKVYDSLVDNILDPQIFVSCHNDNQAYPEFLLEFLPFDHNFQQPKRQVPSIIQPLTKQHYYKPIAPFPKRRVQGVITPGGFQIY